MGGRRRLEKTKRDQSSVEVEIKKLMTIHREETHFPSGKDTKGYIFVAKINMWHLSLFFGCKSFRSCLDWRPSLILIND